MPRDEKPEKEAKPGGWQKLRRHDSPDGPPEVGFDPERRQHYEVLADKSIRWNEKPPGGLDENGIPRRGEEAEPEPIPVVLAPPPQIRGTEEQAASIAGTEVVRATGDLKTEEVKRG